MKEIVIATSNQGKLQEFKEILEPLGFKVLSKKDLGLGDLEVEEDRDTLEGNAEKKARAIWERTKTFVLADDTGLFVDGLGGQPGVHTARYGGVNPTPQDNRDKLLRELKGKKQEDRHARFITAIVVIDPQGEVHLAQGICPGSISQEEKGDRGFGYDKLFIPQDYQETFAQMDSTIKNTISHRALALEKLKTTLEGLIR